MVAERRTLDLIETMILDWLHGVFILIQTMITERLWLLSHGARGADGRSCHEPMLRHCVTQYQHG